MNALLDALRKKYRTPAAALAALGLDASILTNKEPPPMPQSLVRVGRDQSLPLPSGMTTMPLDQDPDDDNGGSAAESLTTEDVIGFLTLILSKTADKAGLIGALADFVSNNA